jgi:hypothetical protein
LNNLKQPESSKNSSDLLEALQRPLLTLSQSQEVLMAQLRLLSQKVADIQLNQNSSLMKSSSTTATPESVISSSVSPKKALFPAVDRRAQELHTRVFQNISSSIKPAYHKNTALNNNACFEDGTLEYIPKVNTDIPLSLATSNISPGHSSFAQSLLSPSVSSSSSQLANMQPLGSQRVSMDHTLRVSSAPPNGTGSTPSILSALETQILECLGDPDFDVLCNKMDSSFKSDMKNLLKKTSSIFDNKPIAPPLRGNKKDSIGVTMQENAVLSAACVDTIRKFLELGEVDEAKLDSTPNEISGVIGNR